MRDVRVCPVCGRSDSWTFGLVRHYYDSAKWVHVRLRVQNAIGDKVYQMASILRNGKRWGLE